MDETRVVKFESLYRSHRLRVLGYFARRAGAEVAEDLAAETFLVAWRRLEDVPDESLPWLYGVARNLLANHRRGQARGEALVSKLSGQQLAPLIEPSDQLAADARTESIGAALRRLSARELEVLLLMDWEALDARQAAKAAGCSLVALNARLFRARKKLRRELAALTGSPDPIARVPPVDRVAAMRSPCDPAYDLEEEW